MENTNNNAVTTESGLTYVITKAGDGAEVKAGNEVIVNYTGLLTNGVLFDSSLVRNEPFSFPVGLGMVIKGWDEGLQKLRVGDHATFIIPPAIGYGESGAGGVIPPNATRYRTPGTRAFDRERQAQTRTRFQGSRRRTFRRERFDGHRASSEIQRKQFHLPRLRLPRRRQGCEGSPLPV
ncbi:MAG: FKBP-type peptidyl-prolyl cis-trans isomerase [Acidobacteria bacterium]|nr:FKBP-type peptidyl-prolyl cis-trans isomerase [Acidobacteriota bacterium]